MPMRRKTAKKAKTLCVLHKGRIGIEFGKRLFGDMYNDAAAWVLQKANGEAEMRLFDPAAPAKDVFARKWPEGARVVLYSNHCQKGLEPNEDDLRNLAALPKGAVLYIVRESYCKQWIDK